jgi:hypothetical protein
MRIKSKNGESMDTSKRILLVSDLGPSSQFAGGLVMTDLINALSTEYEIDLILFNSYPEEYKFELPAKSKVVIFGKPGERLPTTGNRILSEIIGLLFEISITRNWLKSSKKIIQKEIQSGKYVDVFFILQGQFMPRLAAELDLSKVRVFSQYWDPLEWHAQNYNLSSRAIKKLRDAYIRFESNRDLNLLVPSEGMKEAVALRSKIKPKYIHVVYPPAQSSKYQGELPSNILEVINKKSNLFVYAGGLYAVDAIKVFIEALELIDFQINGQEINFLVISSEIDALTVTSPNVILSKRLSADMVNRILGEADLSILPYPFDAQILTQQAFPSKFPTYSKHAKNLLLIAPSESSLMLFAKENNLCVGVVSTLSKSGIASELLYLFSYNNQANQSVEIEHIYQKYFTHEVFTSQIRNIFDLKESEALIAKPVSYLIKPNMEAFTKINRFARLIKPLLRFLGRISSRRNLIRRTIRFMISKRMKSNTRGGA